MSWVNNDQWCGGGFALDFEDSRIAKSVNHEVYISLINSTIPN